MDAAGAKAEAEVEAEAVARAAADAAIDSRARQEMAQHALAMSRVPADDMWTNFTEDEDELDDAWALGGPDVLRELEALAQSDEFVCRYLGAKAVPPVRYPRAFDALMPPNMLKALYHNKAK